MSRRTAPSLFPSPSSTVASSRSSLASPPSGADEPPCAIEDHVVSGDLGLAAPPLVGPRSSPASNAPNLVSGRAPPRRWSPAYRATSRARVPCPIQTCQWARPAPGPQLQWPGAFAGDAGWVHLAPFLRVPRILQLLKMLQTYKLHRKINTNQKNINDIPKCSGRQTLPFGVIVQHNKNTFVWCFIKRSKMPFYGIFELL